MELNKEFVQVVWRFIPAFILVLTLIGRLANESRQRSKLSLKTIESRSK